MTGTPVSTRRLDNARARARSRRRWLVATIASVTLLVAVGVLVLRSVRPEEVGDDVVRASVPAGSRVVADFQVHNPAGRYEFYYRYVVLEPAAGKDRDGLFSDVIGTLRGAGWAVSESEPAVHYGSLGEVADVTILPLEDFATDPGAIADSTDGEAVRRLPVRGPRYLLLIFSPR